MKTKHSPRDRMPPAQHPVRRAFTLIELLVVIANIENGVVFPYSKSDM
jgi:type II secretory pathway pseudopilin PulG